MNISIFGLGYVGAVSAACLASDGHSVIGVDVNQTKIDMINQGKSPIIEKDTDVLIDKAHRSGYLRATADSAEAIRNSEISFVCVGTPSQPNGNLDLKYMRRVCEMIGMVLKGTRHKHIVVIRSTILPGSMRNVVIPTLEKHSGKQAGIDFGVCNNPEFLREGSAVYDYYHPAKTIIGETDTFSGDAVLYLYDKLHSTIIRTDLESAELVKYIDNVWHALKIGFANEIGNICKAVGIDGHHLMDIFCHDTKLNISSSYLKPGFAFGGSCLPKDLRAINYKSRQMDLNLPILNAILQSNELQIKKGLQMIMNKGHKKVGILGLSFKAGTDDLRESPMVEIVERLLGKGYDIRIYDRNINLASLIGANRNYLLNLIPHISKLLVGNIQALLQHADTIVIGNNDAEFHNIQLKPDGKQSVVDFVRVPLDADRNGYYDGICW
jgi:GDP-mannose 6-dehydrogenase